MSPITMAPSDTLSYWSGYVQRHPQESPLLARVLPRWLEFFPMEPEAAAGNPLAKAGASNLVWENYSLSPYPSEDEIEDVMEELTGAVTSQMNLVAFERLLELTTASGMSRIEEMDLAKLVDFLDRESDPFTRMALWEGPVSVQVQLTWFAAWWIHDTDPAGVPMPPWVANSRYPDVPEEIRTGSRPRWLLEWAQMWLTHIYGPDGPTSRETTD